MEAVAGKKDSVFEGKIANFESIVSVHCTILLDLVITMYAIDFQIHLWCYTCRSLGCRYASCLLNTFVNIRKHTSRIRTAR